MKTQRLQWHNERRTAADLITWTINPRKISEQQLDQLRQSVTKFDLADPIIVDTDNVIVGGHQRLTVLKLLGRADEQIDVRVPNRKLTDEEFRELALRLNRNQGEWDWQLLEEHFDVGDLLDIGFERFEFGLHNEELAVVDTTEGEPRERVEFMAAKTERSDKVVFECYLSKQNRDRLVEAIRQAKSHADCQTTEDALSIIVNHYLAVYP